MEAFFRLCGSRLLSFTKASDRTQFNFSGDVTYRTERYSGQFNYSSTVGTSNGERDVNRKLAEHHRQPVLFAEMARIFADEL